MVNSAPEKENLQVRMLTLSCLQKDCLTKLRIGRFIYRPTTRVGTLQFCPVCGGKAQAHTDTDETYWETLANSYDLPVQIIQQLYAIWDRNEYEKFYDFVQEMKKDAGLL